MKSTKRAVVRWLQELVGFTVFAHWEGECYKHTTWTRAEALEWMAQYPRGCVVRLAAFGQVHASRGE